MIVVSSLAHLRGTALLHDPSHAVTLLSPGNTDHAAFCLPPERYLLLSFHDIGEPRSGLVAPDRAMIERLLAFGGGWSGAKPMLVHCWTGISRSSAAAYILACARNPGCEFDIADDLRRRAPFAAPNRLMVAQADAILQRDGRMVEAIARLGRGANAFEGTPYCISSDWPQAVARRDDRARAEHEHSLD